MADNNIQPAGHAQGSYGSQSRATKASDGQPESNSQSIVDKFFPSTPAGNFLKGFLSPLTCFVENPLLAFGVLFGGAIVASFFPVIIPLGFLVGLAVSGKDLVKGIACLCNGESDKAMESFGAFLSGMLVARFLAAKLAGNTARSLRGISSTPEKSFFKNTWDCVISLKANNAWKPSLQSWQFSNKLQQGNLLIKSSYYIGLFGSNLFNFLPAWNQPLTPGAFCNNDSNEREQKEDQPQLVLA